MTHEAAAAVFEGRDHGVDVLGACEQEDRGRSHRNLSTDLVEECVVKMRDVSGLVNAARGASGDEPDGEPRWAEERPDDGAGEGSLGGSLADHVSLLVDVHVAARERARTTIRSCRWCSTNAISWAHGALAEAPGRFAYALWAPST